MRIYVFRCCQWVVSCCSKQLFFFWFLAFQNALAVLLVSYSQERQLATGAERFAVTHAVLFQEAIKFIVSFAWCVIDVWRYVRAHAIERNEKELFLDNLDEMQSLPTKFNAGSDVLSSSHLSNSGEIQCKDKLLDSSFQLPTSKTTGRWRLFKNGIVSELFHPSAIRMLIPALLYGFQNCCVYLALANIEPTLFQVTYQSRIIITALFMSFFLGRCFLIRQWVALVVLAFGVSVAQLGDRAASGKERSSEGSFKGDYTIGIVATILSATTSSATSVIMECFLKSRSSSMSLFTSTKNLHLALHSVLCFAVFQALNGSVGGFTESRDASFIDAVRTYFRGFDGLVWVMLVVQAIGGLLVAVVIKYSDNIVRTFAAVISIALSGLCSSYLYAFCPSTTFLIGNAVSIGAIVVYNS
ncbi:CMP-sialic acid transporter, putative [Trypanosoma cruzi marinkellei]|uniref:CMP-sialic acid transporter, putative n=1 Tax=Trypanosoma cruzi marinkellei TaxID=85056 RepID=K2MDV3_TRYCR|nr:CMP-sialic acid transporter, putative [Trypanosoma cruzi marinkellei]